jgi:flagellar protein FliS
MTNAYPSAAYREAAVRGAGPIELVLILHDIVITDLHAAVEAFGAGDVERRTEKLKHALSAIAQLQDALDMENGGEPARQLDRFYDFSRAQILQAQLRQSPDHLKKLSGAYQEVRKAWDEVRVRTQQPAPMVIVPSSEMEMASWSA